MRIKKLTLKNFRRFAEAEFEFGETNYLTGQNGAGKTTIKEAIIFCLYGLDHNGTNKGLDDLIKNGEKVMEVWCEFENFTIKRVRSSNKTRILYIDGSQAEITSDVTQKNLENVLPDVNLFLTVFDSGSFFKLDEKTQRQLILDNTPAVDQKKLFLQHHPAELAEKYNIIFGDYKMERARFMGIKRNLEAEMNQLRTVITTKPYTKEELEAQAYQVLKLKKQFEAETPPEKCDKCGQSIPRPASVKPQYDQALAKFEAMKGVALEIAEKAKEAQKELDAKAEKLKDIQKIIDIFAPNGLPAIELDMKLEPIVKYLQGLNSGIEVKTLREVKTTLEWVECFEVYVNGVIYKRLSTGEQKKIDLAFSKLLDQLTEGQVNMFFIDHKESITGDLGKIDGQVFYAQVAEDSSLTIKDALKK
jgi:DNA repair exonuclease SbcCD ATPase subunit